MGVKVREKDGAWWVFINHQHRRKAKRIGIGKEGKSAANRAAAKIQAKLALGDVGILDDQTPQAIPTFEAVALEWERLTTPNWKRGTQISYGNALRHRLVPIFGSLPITKVTASQVEDFWATARGEGLSKTYLTTFRVILRGVCRRAVSLGLLSTSSRGRSNCPFRTRPRGRCSISVDR